jgi:predicted transcriptional regulator
MNRCDQIFYLYTSEKYLFYSQKLNKRLMVYININKKLYLTKYMSNPLKVIFLVKILPKERGWVKMSYIRRELKINIHNRSQLSEIYKSLYDSGLIKRNKKKRKVMLTPKCNGVLRDLLKFLNNIPQN